MSRSTLPVSCIYIGVVIETDIKFMLLVYRKLKPSACVTNLQKRIHKAP